MKTIKEKIKMCTSLSEKNEILRRADLRGADLDGADLEGAYLEGAYLEGADLRRADLRGADLRRGIPMHMWKMELSFIKNENAHWLQIDATG